MNSLLSQDNKKLQSFWGNGNCLCMCSIDYGLQLEMALSLWSFVDGHMAEVTWTQLVLDNVMVKAMTSHCVPDAVFASIISLLLK